MISVQVKACGPCSRAKRRCGKQQPACDRCVKQRLDCTYPRRGSHNDHNSVGRSVQHHTFGLTPLPLDEHSFNVCPGLGQRGIAAPSPPSTASPGTFSATNTIDSTDTVLGSDHPSLADVQSAWFLRLDSWQVVRFGVLPNRPSQPSLFEDYVTTLTTWLSDWSEGGSNAFVHRHLYALQLPPPILDAFTALVSYVHRSSDTEHLVFRIIERRITELAENENRRVQGTEGPAYDAPSHERWPDLLVQLSRVQALMVYSIMGLFHGNIRLRRVAEIHLPLLASWSQQMLEAATRASSNGEFLQIGLINAVAFPGAGATATSVPLHTLPQTWQQLGEAEKENALWHTWVVAESVRRTWLIARSIETVYLLLRDGTGSCPGGLRFTTAKGVWDADSAFEWAKICAERDVGFLHVGETDKLCTQPTSDAIDEFTKVAIKLNFRTERARRWVEGE